MHGSSRWADAQHLLDRGYGPAGRHTLGFLPAEDRRARAIPITYSGDRHELVIAPTRGGKGVSTVISRLLEHPGPAIVMDVKDGENALITARYRRDVLGQSVHILDHFDVVASALGFVPAKLNPLRQVDLDGSAAFDEAANVSESCVVPHGHGESHWSNEAQAMIAGFILREVEMGGDLRDVRAALNATKEGFTDYIARMLESPYGLVRAAGARMQNKEERELSGVLSTAQANTHFLESAPLADSLSGTSIDLTNLDHTTIYIVLPAKRIVTAKRWLRVVIASLIYAVTELDTRPSVPVMFLLDEMATLGRMSPIEQGVGLLAGFGMQFVCILQDLNQLTDLYRERAQSFISNAASVQCLGTNDKMTAEYLSALSGMTSVPRLSMEAARERASLFGDPSFAGPGDAPISRRLITPDELTSLHPSVQFIKMAASHPVMAYRPAYFLDGRFRDRSGSPLYDIHPHHAGRPIPKALDFTGRGLDLGHVLEPYLRVG
ncbi:MAG: type IV secretory system conjugative DNA transfer family protein [Pseudomonadota bacterium]